MASPIAGLDSERRAFPPAETADGKFLNTVPTVVSRPGRALHFMGRMLTEKNVGDPDRAIGPFHTDPRVYARESVHGLRVTWMGHSSLLIEIDGCRILTDPVWSHRASLVSFAGPERFFAPPLSLAELPPIDAVLLSHDHYDHLDRATVEQLRTLPAVQNARFLCPVGVGRHLQNWGVRRQRITELNWGDSTPLRGRFAKSPGRRQNSSNCQIGAVPARHFSGRGLWSRNQTLWSSFAIRGPAHNIFFGGDSGPSPDFEHIGDSFGPFHLTMLEIGAYDADWPEIHMGPENAAEAHLALRGKLMLPIHWGTFNLAFHPWREPVQRLTALAPWKDIQLVLPKPGVPTDITGASLNTFWWQA